MKNGLLINTLTYDYCGLLANFLTHLRTFEGLYMSGLILMFQAETPPLGVITRGDLLAVAG